MDKKTSLAMRPAPPLFEMDEQGYQVTDSPFSFVGEVLESMKTLIVYRLAYIQLDDAGPEREMHIASLHQYMMTNFSPFHDHLTLLILGDYNLRQRVYCLIFNELSDFGVNGFAGMNYYLSGPLFANAFFAPVWRGRHPNQKLVGGVTHTADGRPIDDDGNVGELEETTIFSKEYMENLRHLSPDLKENVLLEMDSFSSEESLAKARKEHGDE